jgi:hypothetical protein
MVEAWESRRDEGWEKKMTRDFVSYLREQGADEP